MLEFLKIHPKQLISEEIPIPVWRVHYSYMTARGNPKEADKYIIDDEQSWDTVENRFDLYIDEENIKHPERKLSNVEILDTNFLGYAYLILE